MTGEEEPTLDTQLELTLPSERQQHSIQSASRTLMRYISSSVSSGKVVLMDTHATRCDLAAAETSQSRTRTEDAEDYRGTTDSASRTGWTGLQKHTACDPRRMLA